jgi:hypothetical protein
MHLRATSRWYHRHNSEDEDGVGEHFSSIRPSSEQVRTPQQDRWAGALHFWTIAQGAAVTGAELGKVESH